MRQTRWRQVASYVERGGVTTQCSSGLIGCTTRRDTSHVGAGHLAWRVEDNTVGRLGNLQTAITPSLKQQVHRKR